MGDFKGVRNVGGRPKGSGNRVTAELKIVLEQLANDLHQSIDITNLKDSERMKLFVSILPYLMPKKAEIENTNTNTNWLSDFTDEQLNKLLNS
jgi:hypothetical protein